MMVSCSVWLGDRCTSPFGLLNADGKFDIVASPLSWVRSFHPIVILLLSRAPDGSRADDSLRLSLNDFDHLTALIDVVKVLKVLDDVVLRLHGCDV
jgi:hypothetical protein